MNLEFVMFCRAVENVALAVCVTKAALYFNKWSLLWFLIAILFNHPEFKVVTKEKTDEAADL